MNGTCIQTKYGFAYFQKTLDNGLHQYMVRDSGKEYYFNIDIFDTEYDILSTKNEYFSLKS